MLDYLAPLASKIRNYLCSGSFAVPLTRRPVLTAWLALSHFFARLCRSVDALLNTPFITIQHTTLNEFVYKNPVRVYKPHKMKKVVGFIHRYEK